MLVSVFSYTNENYKHELMRIIKELGYKLAVTTKSVMLYESESPFDLRKILIYNDMNRSRNIFVNRISNKV